MSDRETIISVGIDVGTSTTQLVFSRLTVADVASRFAVPAITIVDKHIIYRGPVHLTPLLDPETIDAEALRRLIERDYADAGLSPADIGTGAAIITGETARARNAETVLAALSSLAGDFVVSTAGPHLESVLAARGVGLDSYSETTSKVVANLDIGGGTTNIACYQAGQLLATCCLDLGGRLVRVANGRIQHVASHLQQFAASQALMLRVGDPADIGLLRRLAAVMARQLAMAIGQITPDAAHATLYTNQGQPLPAAAFPAQISFSGGVADLIADPGIDPLRFGDIGVLLAEAIAAEPAFAQLPRHRGTETIGATVVGAGVHTTELTGSTIDFTGAALPLRNVPILAVPEHAEADPSRLPSVIDALLRGVHPEDPAASVALALRGQALTSFAAVQELAGAIVTGARAVLDGPNPLVIVVESDRAKTLGQSIAALRGRRDDVVCLDAVLTGGGDYLDIGKPVGSGRAVPVVVKTLVFNDRFKGER